MLIGLLTEDDGLLGQLKIRLAGAKQYLIKPLQTEEVLAVLSAYQTVALLDGTQSYPLGEFLSWGFLLAGLVAGVVGEPIASIFSVTYLIVNFDTIPHIPQFQITFFRLLSIASFTYFITL